jgi:hypothetical protein
MEKTPEEKKALLLSHYSFDEICEILGYYDGSNEDVATEEMYKLEETDYPLFVSKMMDEAIINGNFEETIEKDVRIGL